MPTAEKAEHDRMAERMRGDPLRRWSGFIIRLHCPSCRDVRDIKVQSLTDQHGNKTVQEVTDRFKCQVCATRPDRIEFHHHVAVWTFRAPSEP